MDSFYKEIALNIVRHCETWLACVMSCTALFQLGWLAARTRKAPSAVRFVVPRGAGGALMNAAGIATA